MLVLTRRKGEGIVINENIIVTVMEVGQGKVRLGIEAPKQVPIMRREVDDTLKRKGKGGPCG